MGVSKNTWRTVLNVCDALGFEFINCPTTDLNEYVYKTKKPNLWFFRCFCDKSFSAKLSPLLAHQISSCGCSKGIGCIRPNPNTWQDLFDACDKAMFKFLNCPTTDLYSKIYKARKREVWKIECHCGKVFSPPIRDVIEGSIVSCGCKRKGVGSCYTWLDLFAKCNEAELIFLHPISNMNDKIYNTQHNSAWFFRCRCGEVFSMRLNHLMRGQVSCGCARIGQPKSTWGRFVDVCKDLGFVFENCPEDLDGLVYDVVKPHQWTIKCHCGNTLGSNLNDILTGRVKSCGCVRSQAQIDVENYIRSLDLVIMSDTRQIIAPLELDVFVPDKQVAIEYCGLHWHGEQLNGINAQIKHSKKYKLCQDKGIRLITIFENEWLEKPEQTKGYLRAILIGADNKIMARKCEIKSVDSKTAIDFHNANHIQGATNGQHIGLYNDGGLIALATFSTFNNRKIAKKDNQIIELKRYTIKVNYSVPGGLSRIIKSFVANNIISQIVSYSDNRWSEGKVYARTGFVKGAEIRPTYYYFDKKSHLYNKSYFMKSKIKNKYPEIDMMNKTEAQLMNELGYDRIWDCGKIKWIYNTPNNSATY